MTTQFFLGISTGLFLVLLVFLIPAILQLKKAGRSVEDFFRTTQDSLNPLLSELKKNLERLNRITEDIEDSTKNIQRLAKSIGETGALIDELNNFVKRTGLSFSVKTASLGVGIKTALNVLTKGIIKKGGDTNE